MRLKTTFEKKDTMEVKGLAILMLLFYHLFENAAVSLCGLPAYGVV